MPAGSRACPEPPRGPAPRAESWLLAASAGRPSVQSLQEASGFLQRGRVPRERAIDRGVAPARVTLWTASLVLIYYSASSRNQLYDNVLEPITPPIFHTFSTSRSGSAAADAKRGR